MTAIRPTPMPMMTVPPRVSSQPVATSPMPLAQPVPTGAPQSFQSFLSELVNLIRRFLGSFSPSKPPATSPTRFYFRHDAKPYSIYGATGAVWLAGTKWDPSTARKTAEAAKKEGVVPVIAQYSIPGRDNKGPSAGGAKTAEEYRQQVEANAKAYGDAPGFVVIEPDGLALGLGPEYVRMAVETWRKHCPNVKIYIDAGHAKWKKPEDMVDLLLKAGIHKADGFALNVSAFEWTQHNLDWGDRAIAELQKRGIHGKQYVIDTSRNGNGPGVDENGKNTWGDPIKARNGGPIMNGPKPTNDTGNPNAAAFLWVKGPGHGDNRIRKASEFGGEAWVKHHPNAPLGPAK